MKRLVNKLLWLLLATNIYVGLAGGALTYTAEILQNNVPGISHLLISFFYLFAMHNLNRFTDRKQQKYSDPLRAFFYEKYRWPFLAVSAISLGCALTVVYEQGLKPFLLLTGMSIFGILYSVQVIPKSLIPNIRIRGLKQIPGSKTFLVAVAWAFVTTLIPAWSNTRTPDPGTLAVLFFVMLLVFVRNALFDVFEVQGDRIVGRETLPVCIGEKKTLLILNFILLLLLILLLVLPLSGLMAEAGLWLLPGIVYIIGLTQMYYRGRISQGPKLEFCLDSVFYLLAGLAWLSAFSG